jgi:hypothetical protein
VTPVLVTARLAGELAGEPPQLDALLIAARCRFHPSAGAHERYDPAPPMNKLPPCGIEREWLGDWLVHRCSSPIVDAPLSDRHERIGQHFPRERATLLAASEQGTIATTNGAQKSMYLPVRKRLIMRVAWFALVHHTAEFRRDLKRSVKHLGQDRSRGNGRVAEWTVEIVEADYSWFAPHPQGTVLMRQLPVGDWLPADLVGAFQEYDACTPPYWHPSRKTSVMRPV